LFQQFGAAGTGKLYRLLQGIAARGRIRPSQLPSLPIMDGEGHLLALPLQVALQKTARMSCVCVSIGSGPRAVSMHGSVLPDSDTVTPKRSKPRAQET
jgi:hypothetical protein